MSEFQFHPLADLFPLMQGEEFDALVADIKANGLRERLDLYQGKIIDGRNRYRALQRLGIDPSADQKQYFRKAIYAHSAGGEIAPHEQDNDARVRAYIISKNIHRRHLTAEQKRELIAKLVKAQPEKSDRAIGKMAKVDGKTVAAVRAEQEERAEIPHVEKRTDSKGRKQPAKKATPLVDGTAKNKPPGFIDPSESHQEALYNEACLALRGMNYETRERFFAEVGPSGAWGVDIEEDVLDLLKEVLDDEPLTDKQAEAFEKIKKRLRRRAREDAKREATWQKFSTNYKAALPPFVARLKAAGLARDLWLALTVRGPCGYKEGYAMWLVPPPEEAIEEVLGPEACCEPRNCSLAADGSDIDRERARSPGRRRDHEGEAGRPR